MVKKTHVISTIFVLCAETLRDNNNPSKTHCVCVIAQSYYAIQWKPLALYLFIKATYLDRSFKNYYDFNGIFYVFSINRLDVTPPHAVIFTEICVYDSDF